MPADFGGTGASDRGHGTGWPPMHQCKKGTFRHRGYEGLEERMQTDPRDMFVCPFSHLKVIAKYAASACNSQSL